MIDQVELAVPHQQVRVPRGPVCILGERIEPHHQRCFVLGHYVSRRGIEHRRAGQIIERQIQAYAALSSCRIS